MILFGETDFLLPSFFCAMISLLKAQLSRWHLWQGLSTNRRIFSDMLVVEGGAVFTGLVVVRERASNLLVFQDRWGIMICIHLKRNALKIYSVHMGEQFLSLD